MEVVVDEVELVDVDVGVTAMPTHEVHTGGGGGGKNGL
jgi:hypothetical protein